jgi:hypothetical protein
MPDCLRPSTEELCAAFYKGYGIWLNLYERSAIDRRLSQYCYQIHDIFGQLPYFPADLQLKPLLFPGRNFLYATGTSTWETSNGLCEAPPIQLHHDLLIGIPCATSLSLTFDASYKGWFADDDNHLSILFLAWAYILSVR